MCPPYHIAEEGGGGARRVSKFKKFRQPYVAAPYGGTFREGSIRGTSREGTPLTMEVGARRNRAKPVWRPSPPLPPHVPLRCGSQLRVEHQALSVHVRALRHPLQSGPARCRLPSMPENLGHLPRHSGPALADRKCKREDCSCAISFGARTAQAECALRALVLGRLDQPSPK